MALPPIVAQDSPDALTSDARERKRRVLVACLGSAGLVVAVAAVMTQFGPLKIAVISVALVLAVVALVDKHLYWVPRLLLLIVMSYLTLFVADLALWSTVYRVDTRLLLRGLHVNDPDVGYRLTPYWEVEFDDGVVGGVQYRINGLGHRDTEPAAEGVRRTFIIGDSFAFGNLLDQRETIDSQIEKMSDDEFSAYNLGVPGYGAPAALHAFKSVDFSGESAVYLFYENDLRNDGLETERNTVRRGFLVQGLDDDGTPYDEAELDEKIDCVLSPLCRVADAILLRHFIKAMDAARNESSYVVVSLDEGSNVGPLGYARDNEPRVLDATVAMQSLAYERGMKFVVFIIPSMVEIDAGHHDDRVTRYISGLKQSDIQVLDPISDFSISDYYAHDGHFNPVGAGKVASRVLEWLRGSTGTNAD